MIPITNVHNTLTATALGVPGHQEQICGLTPAQACCSLWNSSASSLDFYLRLGWAHPGLASSGRHLYPQVICSAVDSCLSKTQAIPWSHSQWDEVSFFALLSERPITLVHLQGALSPVAFIQKATLHPAGLTWSHAFQKTFFICCIDLLKWEATSQERPAGCVAWPPPKGCLCKSQVWFCGKALHPDPSSSRRLKETVFLAVPVPTSSAVAWRCDSPLGHAEPSQSYVTPQKDWWVTQELLTLPSPAPSPSTASAAKSAGVCTSPLQPPSKAMAVPPEKSQGERKCSSITSCDLLAHSEFWGPKPFGFCSFSQSLLSQGRAGTARKHGLCVFIRYKKTKP